MAPIRAAFPSVQREAAADGAEREGEGGADEGDKREQVAPESDGQRTARADAVAALEEDEAESAGAGVEGGNGAG